MDYSAVCNYWRISIHAPTKGATILPESPFLAFLFQSTLPRRERLSCKQCALTILYFNPRSHEGSDGVFLRDSGNTCQFQSTLPRRERLKHLQDKGRLLIISIHAPTKGATAILYNKFLLFHIILTNPSKDT